MRLNRLLKTFIVVSMLVIFSTSLGWARYEQDVVLTDVTGLWVDSRAYATLSACITAVETIGDPATIVIAENESIDTDAIASYIHLKFIGDGRITVNAGETLTLSTRSIDAQPGQIFAGTGAVDFADGTVVDARWFSSVYEAIDETSDDTVVLVVSGDQSLTESIALGANVSLLFQSPGDKITISNTKTLSNVTHVIAGNWQIFAGLGSLTYSDDATFRYPAWDGSTNEPELCDGDRDTCVNVGDSADEDKINFYISGVEQLHIEDGAVLPETDNDVDLGSAAKQFQDIYGVLGHLGSLQLGGAGATPTEFSTDGTFAGNSDTAIPTEKASKAYIDNTIAALDLSPVVSEAFPGLAARPTFRWKDADEVYVDAASYHHDGTTEQLVFWNALLTKAGVFAGTQWYYLYIDDSAVVALGSNELTAAELQWSAVGPSWDHTKHGYYNGPDRCIFMGYVSGGNLVQFSHVGDYIEFDAESVRFNATTPNNNWSTQITFLAPENVSRVRATFYAQADGVSSNAFVISYREGSSTGAGHRVVSGGFASGDYRWRDINTTEVFIDTNRQIDVKADNADTDILLTVAQNGWYLPAGM